MREMLSGRGFQLDADFITHAGNCKACAGYDGSPATLAKLCLDGSVLLKLETPRSRPTKVEMPTDRTKVSKIAAKAAIHYK